MDQDEATEQWWNREQTDEEIEAGAQRIIDECYGGVLPTAKQMLEDLLLMRNERKQNAAQN